MFVTMNNVVGGGDSWVVDSNGIPEKKLLQDTANDHTVVFNVPSNEYAYEAYVNVADGEPYPKAKGDPVCDSTNMTITFTVPPVTIAQTGGSGSTAGEECYMQLRIIK